MKLFQKLFQCAYVAISIVFLGCALVLLGFSLMELGYAVDPRTDTTMRLRFISVMESVGLLTIAVAALELGQTILEEEVQRSASISAPTRVRRFVSRFMVVIVVSLSIECLVGVFQFLHGAPQFLPHAASIGIAAAFLLVAWGVFIHFNIAAEHLEPDAAREAKAEDQNVES